MHQQNHHYGDTILRRIFYLFIAIGLLPMGIIAGDDTKLFVARPLTAEKSFTAGIEGPNCDAQGNVYVVNFARQQTIGKVTPDGKAEVYLSLPGKSTGNGIVFDRKGNMYVADHIGHNVLRVDMKTSEVT